VLRHYDSELIRALQQRGFEVYGAQLLLVRDLALKLRLHQQTRAKEKKVSLVPAGLARAVPTPAVLIRWALTRPVGGLPHASIPAHHGAGMPAFPLLHIAAGTPRRSPRSSQR
jgi:hypothetical protein